MNLTKRITLISITAVLAVLAVSVSSASAGGWAKSEAKRAANTVTKIRDAVTQATNLNGPRAEAAATGRCLSNAANAYTGEDTTINQFYTMIVYGYLNILGEAHRATPGTMNWGAGVLKNAAEKTPNKRIKQGLFGHRDILMIGKSFPASDYCGVLSQWEANGYTGAKALINAELGPGVYDQAHTKLKSSFAKIGKARQVISKHAGYGTSWQFETEIPVRILMIFISVGPDPEPSAVKALIP